MSGVPGSLRSCRRYRNPFLKNAFRIVSSGPVLLPRFARMILLRVSLSTRSAIFFASVALNCHLAYEDNGLFSDLSILEKRLMRQKSVKDRSCMNQHCTLHAQFRMVNIIRHSFYKTRQGRRHRYLCKACKKTFCSTAGTPYYRLHKLRSTFDEVAKMIVKSYKSSKLGFCRI